MSDSPSISGVINFEKVVVRGDLARLTVSLPVGALPFFKDFMGSAAALSSFINTKAKYGLSFSKQHRKEFQASCDVRYQALKSLVLESFNKHSASGLAFRQAVREVKNDLAKTGWEVTCGMIELILKDHKQKGYSK